MQLYLGNYMVDFYQSFVFVINEEVIN